MYRMGNRFVPLPTDFDFNRKAWAISWTVFRSAFPMGGRGRLVSVIEKHESYAKKRGTNLWASDLKKTKISA